VVAGGLGLRMRAQRLKILKNGKLGYDLGYRTGRARDRQVDLVVDGAEAGGLQAAYVLYSGPELDLKTLVWNCVRLPPSPSFFGVSILPARVARDLVIANGVNAASVGPPRGRGPAWPAVTLSGDPADGRTAMAAATRSARRRS
jgi:hypothetical protein